MITDYTPATDSVLRSAVLALADDWDDFEHDLVTCPKYDCGDCTMKNAVYDLRTCVESIPVAMRK